MQNTNDSNVIAEQLSLYLSSVTDSNASFISQNTLTIDRIDSYLTNISGVNVTNSNTDSILVAKPPYQGNNTIVLGASFSTGVGGKVIVQFYIDLDGSVRDAKVVKDNAGRECAKRALTAVNNMPKWNPGKQGDKAVRVYHILPITFQVN